MDERLQGRCPFDTCPITLKEILEEVEGEVLWGQDKLQMRIKTAFASDLMSDVLAFAKEGCLLLTGLTNAQVIRTAEMLDIAAVLFVRGKRPQKEAMELAAKSGIPLLTTPYILFEACGRLYRRGLVGSSRKAREASQE